MRILYFHQYFSTPSGFGGVRSYEFARRWVNAGHKVSVITSAGFDKTLEKGNSYYVDGIGIKVIGGAYRPTMGLVRRIWAYLCFAIQSSWIAYRSKENDVVLATSTPLTIAIPAIIAKVLKKRKVIFEVRDVWPDAAVDAGVLKKGLLYQCARYLEMMAYRKSDHIVALSDGMADRIISKGISSSKITILPNCCDVEIFSPQHFDRGALRSEYGVENRFVLLYVGAINTANDMPFLVRCIEAFRENAAIKWWFIGGGNQLQYIKSEVRRIGAENVKFWGKMPKCEVPRFVNAADAGIVSFINQPVYFENSPNKFFDYIAGGLPPIFTRTTWLEPYLEKQHAALICENNSVEEFVSFVEKLILDSVYRDQICISILEMSKQIFSRDKVSSRYLKLLTSLS